MDSPILGRCARPALLPWEMSLSRKQKWTLHGPHRKQFSHWLLAVLRAAAHGPVEGLGGTRTELQLSEIQDKIVCPKIEPERQCGAFSQERNANSEKRASLQTKTYTTFLTLAIHVFVCFFRCQYPVTTYRHLYLLSISTSTCTYEKTTKKKI